MSVPLPFTWPSSLIFWSVTVWAFYPEFRLFGRARMRGPAPAEDRGSLRVLVAGFNLAVSAAFVLPFVVPAAVLPGNQVTWFSAGILMLVGGSLLRRHCFRVLGRFFTGAVTIQADHRVIETGAYRWVRHPSYTAALLLVLGIALCCGNWLGVAFSVVIAFLAYNYRAGIEEQALLASLGEPYARFMSARRRFIPFLW